MNDLRKITIFTRDDLMDKYADKSIEEIGAHHFSIKSLNKGEHIQEVINRSYNILFIDAYLEDLTLNSSPNVKVLKTKIKSK